MLELDLQRASEAAAPDEADFRRWCELALRQRSAAAEIT
ncbi:rRNA maturation RNase YbeY, partial [Pseudomonas sp. S75]|nr:rRNA maturation RNase YbeY [Pseudomonas sp. S75]